MKNYKDSDYALNKYSEGIVYHFANQVIEINLSDYLAENPGKTESDFRALKKFSDADYLDQTRDENVQTYKNTSYENLEKVLFCKVGSPDEVIVDASENAERRRQRLAVAKRALDKLTDVQQRRYLLYHVNGLTMRQIAKIEGVLHTKIQKSLKAAEKKIKKFLAEG